MKQLQNIGTIIDMQVEHFAAVLGNHFAGFSREGIQMTGVCLISLCGNLAQLMSLWEISAHTCLTVSVLSVCAECLLGQSRSWVKPLWHC